MTDATTVYQVGVGYGYNTPEMDKQTYENYTGVNVVDRLSDIAGSVVQNAAIGLGVAVANASKAFFTGAVTIAVGEIVYGGVAGAAWGFYTGVKSENEDVLRQLQNGSVQKIQFSSYNAVDPMKSLPTTTNASDGSHTYGVQLVNGQKFYYNDKTNDLTQVGSAGDDTISGSNKADTISGSSGNDTVYGKDGADGLHGNSGNDTIYGGSGNDRLYGDSGIDYITGGDGADTIAVDSTHLAANRDRIYFDMAEDMLNISTERITRVVESVDANDIHRITDFYVGDNDGVLTDDTHVVLQAGDGGDGRYGTGHVDWTPAQLETWMNTNSNHDMLV